MSTLDPTSSPASADSAVGFAQMVNALRSEKAVSPALRVDFGLPSVEPMLWVPDAIAGAVAGARKGSQAGHRQVLGAMVQEIEIAL
ncbi:hypothetical protein GHK92_00100 [Nocardioides sp. dk4132]|uniref:hypothetical protein n=1 Tax=unclassified Nocardioides TaxID=2615069 RepID=UPI0012958076|nr:MULTISPECIES: hypothetical protein [unclassified Nocardioides]MQW74265.1 hypothetical protein [Nocardioides sp. dk4132]QGA06222.1 hypothetical protein GFH29_01555 [Nocardioides sp. dk884]